VTLAVPAATAVRPDGAVDPYAHLDAAERYIHTTRDRALLALLRRREFDDLGKQRIIELGCGDGAWLRSLLHYGADPAKVEGVDLSPERSRRARASGADVGVADIAVLPYRDGAFDLAFAFTAFSSILDQAARRRAAKEALRVVREGGLVVVYDFWINPLNARARPVSVDELRGLFAPHRIEMERVTLAPPIVRALGGRANWCAPLERIGWLRTHLLAAVRKERLA
jgi:SAM-dependent methyltransferase